MQSKSFHKLEWVATIPILQFKSLLDSSITQKQSKSFRLRANPLDSDLPELFTISWIFLQVFSAFSGPTISGFLVLFFPYFNFISDIKRVQYPVRNLKFCLKNPVLLNINERFFEYFEYFSIFEYFDYLSIFEYLEYLLIPVS